jgi:hypothetical protein
LEGDKLEEKDDIGYNSKDKLLQYYVLEMINNVTKENRRILMKQKGKYQIEELGLDFVSKQYKKLIFKFHTSSKTR